MTTARPSPGPARYRDQPVWTEKLERVPARLK